MRPLRKLIASTGRRLGADASGVALLEFALTLPVLLLLSLTGAELTNYITTRMRISQVSLHVADNAARIGSGTQLSLKTITEADINDLFIGAGLQSGELDLHKNGRVFLTSLEPDPDHSGKYRVRWRRCYGLKTSHQPLYPPKVGSSPAPTTNLTGIGPVGRQVIAPPEGVTMFVEVYYEYQPLVRSALAPSSNMTEIASMMVRDRRDTTGGTNGVYAVAGVTASTC